MLVKYIAVVYE